MTHYCPGVKAQSSLPGSEASMNWGLEGSRVLWVNTPSLPHLSLSSSHILSVYLYILARCHAHMLYTQAIHTHVLPHMHIPQLPTYLFTYPHINQHTLCHVCVHTHLLLPS